MGLLALRPVPKRFPITNPWGRRDSRYTAGYHTGTDFGCPTGTLVRAPRAGRVLTAGYDDSYGYYVEIKTWTGKQVFLLAHLRTLKARTGQRVRRGQVVGLSGETGNTRGAHLHAEQRHYPFGYYNTEKPGWE